jgi:hypothetical protein
MILPAFFIPYQLPTCITTPGVFIDFPVGPFIFLLQPPHLVFLLLTHKNNEIFLPHMLGEITSFLSITPAHRCCSISDWCSIQLGFLVSYNTTFPIMLDASVIWSLLLSIVDPQIPGLHTLCSLGLPLSAWDCGVGLLQFYTRNFNCPPTAASRRLRHLTQHVRQCTLFL